MLSSPSSNNQSPPSDSLFSFVISLSVLIFLVLVFKSSILDANNIPSGSMIPTLKIGDYLFINKMRYSVRLPFAGKEIVHIDNPERGDVITFIPPLAAEKDKHYVKRVMGMPGDRIRIREMSACELQKEGRLKLGWMDQSSFSDKKSLEQKQQQKNYKCYPAYADPHEPVISVVEYRERDQGSWKSYPLRELGIDITKKELLDADNQEVLPLSYRGKEERYPRKPILYSEQVGNVQHLIVETSMSHDIVEEHFPNNDDAALCPQIYSEGCLIPDRYYFVMGDNRDYSQDSRFIGLISRDSIYGKVVIVYFSINWRDDLCAHYWSMYRNGNLLPNDKDGLPLPHFPPQKQHSYCSEYDFYYRERLGLPSPSAVSFLGYIGNYFYNTARYRLPRMSVRWQRLGSIID